MIDIERDYEPLVISLSRGCTTRTNHLNCPAGQDRKRRLYLTCPDNSPNIVLGYCHNCQEAGLYKRGAAGRYRQLYGKTIDAPVLVTPSFQVPQDMVSAKEWPSTATTWRIKAGLSKYNCDAIGIKFDPHSNRIFLPMWELVTVNKNDTRNLLGFQLRQVEPSARGPKYYTSIKHNDIATCTSLINIDAGNAPSEYSLTILVEDLASGIAIHNVAMAMAPYNINVIVNYGTKISIEILSKHRSFKKGLVWLDNDGPHIDEQSGTIARVWAMISGKSVSRETALLDPKKYKGSEIKVVLNRVLENG